MAKITITVEYDDIEQRHDQHVSDRSAQVIFTTLKDTLEEYLATELIEMEASHD